MIRIVQRIDLSYHETLDSKIGAKEIGDVGLRVDSRCGTVITGKNFPRLFMHAPYEIGAMK